MENQARYIIRASFSQERMTYLPEGIRIIYRLKDKRQEKIIDAVAWLGHGFQGRFQGFLNL